VAWHNSNAAPTVIPFRRHTADTPANIPSFASTIAAENRTARLVLGSR